MPNIEVRNMLHYIVTRMGLGKRDDEFYKEHIELCRLTLSRSLEAQTNKNFTWAVAIDARAPDWVDEQILKMAPSVKTEVWRRDPLLVGFRPLERSLLKESNTYITTRIDDDDFLHISFVNEIQRQFLFLEPISAITYSRGLDLTSDGLYQKRYAWFSAGLSVLTKNNLDGHVYRYSHTKTGTIVSEAGGTANVLDTPHPMWIRSWRLSSDSSAAKGFRIDTSAPAYVNWEDYGTDDQCIYELRNILSKASTGGNGGVLTKSSIPRLSLKSYLLEEIRRKKAATCPADEIEKLAQIMYLL